MRCVICRAIERCARLVRSLRAQVDVGSAHTPQLQTARPADLVELEVPFVAWIPLVPAPDLHGRARIPHQGGHGAAAGTGDAIRLIRRARRRRAAAGLRRVVVPLRIEPLGPERDVAVGAERATGTGEMGVGEEVAEPGVREMLLDAAARLLGRAIRALRQPAALRRDPEQTTVLVLAHRQLQPDALVAGEERQVPVRGRGPDDLEAPPLLGTAEGGYQALVHVPVQRLTTRER